MKPSEMTDSQLNEAIAKARGLLREMNGCDHIQWQVGGDIKDNPPDYCNSWQYAGELLEEMPFQTKLINYEDEGNGREFWTCNVTNLLNGREVAYVQAGSPTRAIAEAWYAMNGGEG